MPYVKFDSYCSLPFSSETAEVDFYVYRNIEDIMAKSEKRREDSFNCRAVGILHSLNGRFYLTNISTSTVDDTKPAIQVSLIYLKSPIQSIVQPTIVQILGTVRWKKRPVILAKIVQILTPSMAIRLSNTLDAVSMHIAKTEELDEANGSIMLFSQDSD